ncbi:hypothetical protein C2857_004177 [Epichloe festucae Fl1]|uniref:Ankyrin repeat protein n=1 Tax=Epichloe festucae (strain Fl1) TaxID=877507 RepID=A0A7U3Q296_EPIFF|nr:hypothetical protein C2857_004177 [Epichloe festucae Fl1]
MATSCESALRSTLAETIAAISSAFRELKLQAIQELGILKEPLAQLHHELCRIFGIVIGLHRLVQRYEEEGQTLNTTGPYLVLERCTGIAVSIRKNIDTLTVTGLHTTLRSLQPCQSIVALACNTAHTLVGIHHKLAPDVYSQSPVGSKKPCQAHYQPKSVPMASLETVYGLVPDQRICTQRTNLEECLETDPDDATILQWMQELNSPSNNRPPLELFPELCLVRVRNQQRPMYRVAASRWYRCANSRWSVIRFEAEKLVSNSQSNNFIQWVLEFGRNRFPDQLECAGHQDRASKIIELTDELEQGRLTPLHLASMLGLHELCKSLLSLGAAVNVWSSFGSPLYCGLMGPKVLIQRNQPSSWPKIIDVMEPADSNTIQTIISSGADCACKFQLPQVRPGHAKLVDPTLASLGFVASVKGQNHEIFQNVMRAGGSLDYGFSLMLISLFSAPIPSDSRELIARLVSIVLGYNFVHGRHGKFPWDGQDDVIVPIWDLVEQNDLQLLGTTRMDIPLLDDDTFHMAVQECVLNGCHIYLQRLAMDPRFACEILDGVKNCTILHTAVSGQRLDMIRILVSSGANFYAVDDQGRTPLMVAEDPAVLSVLVKRHGVSTTSTDYDGRNIWHYAAATNDLRIMEWLCVNDPSSATNINTVTKHGCSPLIESLLYINNLIDEFRESTPARPDVAYKLLQQDSIDCNAGSAELPIAHLAVQWGESDLVSLLVDKGVNFEVLDHEGRSPLHHLNSSAEPELVRRLVELCGRLPLVSRAGITPLESLYANSFPTNSEGRFLSNHPSCFKAVPESTLRPLLTREALRYRNRAGEGCWALFCKTAQQCFKRCSRMEEEMPGYVERSFLSGMMCLHEHRCLEAHEDETGQIAILAFASQHEDGITSWSLETNPLIEHMLDLCIPGGTKLMKQFSRTPEAFQLMLEALRLQKVRIVHFLADELPLREPTASLGDVSILEYAMKLKGEQLDSVSALFSHVDTHQLNAVGSRLCGLLFEPGIDTSRKEKLGILLDRGLCPNTRIGTQVPEKDMTILSEAVAQEWHDVVSILLDHGAHPGLGRTGNAIAAALLSNNVATLSLLIGKLETSFDWNFTVFFKDTPGYNAIDVAIRARAHESLEMLFSRTNIRSIIHSRSDVNLGTPAHFAARMNDARSIRILRENGADLGRIDDRGRTISHIAAEISSSEAGG